MKALRVISSTLIGIIIFALLVALSLSFVFKKVVEKEIAGNLVKQALLEDYIKDADDKDKEKIEKVFKEDDVNTLISLVIDEYTESVTVENYKVSEKTIDQIIDLCVKHIDLINEFSDEKITVSDLKSQKTRDELTKSFNKALRDNDKDNDATENVEEVIKVYKTAVSSSFRTAMIVLIIIFTALIALINFSAYKWMKYLGGSLISCGIIISTIYVGLTLILEKFIEAEGYNVKSNLRYILVLGLAEIVIGLGLIIVNHTIKEKVKNGNSTNKDEFQAERPKDDINSEM